MIEQGALRIEVEPAIPEGRVTVRLLGELDMEATSLVEAKLIELLDGDAAEVVVDLAGLRFVDSTGLQGLLAAATHARAGGRELRFEAPSGQVADLLRLTEVDGPLGLGE